jgi:hypothetical protein
MEQVVPHLILKENALQINPFLSSIDAAIVPEALTGALHGDNAFAQAV